MVLAASLCLGCTSLVQLSLLTEYRVIVGRVYQWNPCSGESRIRTHVTGWLLVLGPRTKSAVTNSWNSEPMACLRSRLDLDGHENLPECTAFRCGFTCGYLLTTSIYVSCVRRRRPTTGRLSSRRQVEHSLDSHQGCITKN